MTFLSHLNINYLFSLMINTRMGYSIKHRYTSGAPDNTYTRERHEVLSDRLNAVPWKQKHRVELVPGWYGYTYLGRPECWINADLDVGGYQDRKTHIHESIHTDDEYETRAITAWILGEEAREQPYEQPKEPYKI